MRPHSTMQRLKFAAILCLVAPVQPQDARTRPSDEQAAWSPYRAWDLMQRAAPTGGRARKKIVVKRKDPAQAVAQRMLNNPRIYLEQVPPSSDDEEGDVIAPPQRRFMVASRSFDWFVLGKVEDLDSVRVRLESVLANRINAIDGQHRLTLDQQTKLHLAGRGDIKRLFDRIDDERKRFELVRTNIRECQIFLRDLQPLALSVQDGPFHADSLFARTFQRILEVEEEALARARL